MTYEAPAIVQRAEVGGPLIGRPVGSPLPNLSPAWRRTGDPSEDDSE